MGPFNCANWYHSRVIPRESGARAAAGPPPTSAPSPTGTRGPQPGLRPPHLPQRAKGTGCPLLTPPHGLAAPLLEAAPPAPDPAPFTEKNKRATRAWGGGRLQSVCTHEHTRQARAHRHTRPATQGCSSDACVAKLSVFTQSSFHTPKAQLALPQLPVAASCFQDHPVTPFCAYFNPHRGARCWGHITARFIAPLP